MPQRECGALERAQAAERFLHAPLNLRALREPLRARRPGGRDLHRRLWADVRLKGSHYTGSPDVRLKGSLHRVWADVRLKGSHYTGSPDVRLKGSLHRVWADVRLKGSRHASGSCLAV